MNLMWTVTHIQLPYQEYYFADHDFTDIQ